MSFTKIKNYFTKSYKHFGFFLFIVTTLVAIPFTLSILAKQQDNRSRADFQIADEGPGQGGFGFDATQYFPGGGNGATVLDSGQGNQNPQNNQSPFLLDSQEHGGQSPYLLDSNPNSWQSAPNNNLTGNLPYYSGGGAGGPVQVYCPGLGIIQAPYCPQSNQIPTQPSNQLATSNTSSNTNSNTTSNAGTNPQLVTTGTNCSVSQEDLALDPEEQRFITLLNQYRQSLGIAKPLQSSAILAQEAAWMANDTTTNHYIAHEPDSLNRTRLQRSTDCGMTQPNLNSEVIDAGFGIAFDAAASLTNFKNEPAHDALLKQPNLQQIGVARKIGPNGSVVWVVDMQSYGDGTTAPTTTVNPSTAPVVTNVPVTVTQIPQTTQPVTTAAPQVGFNFTIQIPGIGNTANQNNNPNGLKTLQVAMFDPSDPTKNVANTNGQLGYNQQNGTFGLTAGAPVGTYHVKVRTDNSLWNDLGILTVTSGQVATVPQATLITGDLNQDNVLNLQDYTLFVSCFGTKTCAFKPIADVNQDGKVNEVDLNIFYSGLANRQGD